MTRSMPKRSAPGNIRPQSIAIDSPPYSSSSMLSPNSPRPPSGMTFTGCICLRDVQGRRGARAVRVLLRIAGDAAARFDQAAHPLRELLAVFGAEAVGPNRIVHEDFDLAAPEPPFLAAENAPAAVDRDRHDRRFRFHREQEGAALEISQTAAGAARAFGKDDDRYARGELRLRFRQARHRRGAVGAVDEDVARGHQRPAEEGDVGERLFRDPAELEARQTLYHHGNVDVALMVRDEDVGTAAVQPLKAGDLEIDAGGFQNCARPKAPDAIGEPPFAIVEWREQENG